MTEDHKLLQLLRKLDNKKKNEFKVGDIIKIMKSNSVGKVVKVKEDQVIFRTFDRPEGWCEHQSRAEIIEKYTLPKNNTQAEKFHAFIQKANRKLYVTTEDFTFTDGIVERTLRAGEAIFIDELPLFITATTFKDPEGYTPSDFYIGLGTETCLTIVRCFAPQYDKYIFLPIRKVKPFKWNPKLIDKVSFP